MSMQSDQNYKDKSDILPVVVGAAVAGAAVLGIVYFTTSAKATGGNSTGQLSNLNLSATPTTVAPDGTVTFTVTATDSSGNPVPGVSVNLQDVTTNTNIQSEDTNSSGVATFTYIVPSSMQPGNYVFQAVS